jgi:acetyltransferase-like isoleucine patch superfamily enzyme
LEIHHSSRKTIKKIFKKFKPETIKKLKEIVDTLISIIIQKKYSNIGEIMKNKESYRSIKGPILLSLISFIVFSLGFFPIIILFRILLIFIQFNQLWHYILLPFLIYIALNITIYFQLLISGLIIHIFNIKYTPGEYKYLIKDKTALKWMVINTIYTPMSKILEIFQIGRLKYTYYRLIGMKIGKNSLVGGVIKDPCVTEFGNNVTMGEYAIIYGHIHNYEKRKITIYKVKIGNNCIIGAGSIIMPGATLEDNVKLAAGAIVTKGQVLKKGKTYAGIPAKEIKKEK